MEDGDVLLAKTEEKMHDFLDKAAKGAGRMNYQQYVDIMYDCQEEKRAKCRCLNGEVNSKEQNYKCLANHGCQKDKSS